MPYRCPQCKEDVGLYENVTVPGWRAIDGNLRPTGEDDCDWSLAQPDSWANPEVGCGECGWEGRREQFEKVGIDGEPLPFIHEGQQRIEVDGEAAA